MKSNKHMDTNISTECISNNDNNNNNCYCNNNNDNENEKVANNNNDGYTTNNNNTTTTSTIFNMIKQMKKMNKKKDEIWIKQFLPKSICDNIIVHGIIEEKNIHLKKKNNNNNIVIINENQRYQNKNKNNEQRHHYQKQEDGYSTLLSSSSSSSSSSALITKFDIFSMNKRKLRRKRRRIDLILLPWCIMKYDNSNNNNDNNNNNNNNNKNNNTSTKSLRMNFPLNENNDNEEDNYEKIFSYFSDIVKKKCELDDDNTVDNVIIFRDVHNMTIINEINYKDFLFPTRITSNSSNNVGDNNTLQIHVELSNHTLIKMLVNNNNNNNNYGKEYCIDLFILKSERNNMKYIKEKILKKIEKMKINRNLTLNQIELIRMSSNEYNNNNHTNTNNTNHYKNISDNDQNGYEEFKNSDPLNFINNDGVDDNNTAMIGKQSHFYDFEVILLSSSTITTTVMDNSSDNIHHNEMKKDFLDNEKKISYETDDKKKKKKEEEKEYKAIPIKEKETFYGENKESINVVINENEKKMDQRELVPIKKCKNENENIINNYERKVILMKDSSFSIKNRKALNSNMNKENMRPEPLSENKRDNNNDNNNNTNLVECQICFTKYPHNVNDNHNNNSNNNSKQNIFFPEIGCDQHKYQSCKTCLSKYVISKIKNWNVQRNDLTCMFYKCTYPLEPTEIQFILTSDTTDDCKKDSFDSKNENENIFNEYLEKLTRKIYNIRCSKCDNPIDIDLDNTIGVCKCPYENCGFIFCPRGCQIPHPNQTCEESRAKLILNKQERATRHLAEREGWIKCPRCRICICDKADANECDHVKCPVITCQHEFCYLCFADRSIILQHDNSYHLRGCPYFSPNKSKQKPCNKCNEEALCKRPTSISLTMRTRMNMLILRRKRQLSLQRLK